MASRKKKNGVNDRPPFGTDEFWARHEAAEAAKREKRKLGQEIQKFIDRLVKKHGKTRDPRRDIAWFLSQYGSSLMSDIEREKAEARRKRIEENQAQETE